MCNSGSGRQRRTDPPEAQCSDTQPPVRLTVYPSPMPTGPPTLAMIQCHKIPPVISDWDN